MVQGHGATNDYQRGYQQTKYLAIILTYQPANFLTFDGTIFTEIVKCIFHMNAFPQHGLSETRLVEKSQTNDR